jgi:REP element-mobilizing transposase RayT
MKYDPDIHHRHSIRLREYDYSANGAYFVTICTQGRECLFGDIVEGQMNLNDAGRMVEEVWLKLPERFPQITLDERVIMPNHFHGIICIVGVPKKQGAASSAPTLGAIMRVFKSIPDR